MMMLTTRALSLLALRRVLLAAILLLLAALMLVLIDGCRCRSVLLTVLLSVILVATFMAVPIIVLMASLSECASDCAPHNTLDAFPADAYRWLSLSGCASNGTSGGPRDRGDGAGHADDPQWSAQQEGLYSDLCDLLVDLPAMAMRIQATLSGSLPGAALDAVLDRAVAEMALLQGHPAAKPWTVCQFEFLCKALGDARGKQPKAHSCSAWPSPADLRMLQSTTSSFEGTFQCCIGAKVHGQSNSSSAPRQDCVGHFGWSRCSFPGTRPPGCQ